MATLIVPLAIGLASRALVSLLTPTQVQEGQRLDDLDIAKSEYGYNLAKPFGRVRYNGCNLFWAQPLREEIKNGGGGKGNGNKNKTKEYIYYGTFAVNFGYDECIITRIWLNGKLIYNPFSLESFTTEETFKIEAEAMEIYPGTTTQNPSPTIESYEGVGNVTAFRRRPYIVFNDLELTEEFNSAIPKVDVEVIANGVDTVASTTYDVTNIYLTNGESSRKLTTFAEVLLGVFLTAFPGVDLTRGLDFAGNNPLSAFKTPLTDVLRYINDDAGLQETVDYELFYDKFINGSVFKQNGDTYKQYLEDLQRTYNFLAVSDGGKISYIPQDGYDAPTDLLAEDYGAHEYGDSLPDLYIETRSEENELPTSIIFDYKNVNKDHQRGIAEAKRHISNHKNEIRYNTDNILADSEALTAANRNLYQSWAQRQRVTGIKVLPQYIPFIKAGYRIQLPIRGSNVEIQVEQVTIGANYIVEFSGVIVDYSITDEVIDNGTDYDYSNNAIIDVTLPAEAVILDIPLLSDIDALIQSGLYGGALADAEDNWNGGTLVSTLTATTNYSLNESLASAVVHGFTTSTIPFTNPFVVDENTVITVELENGVLESITQDQFESNLTNIMLISGTNEIIAFRDAVLIGSNTYEISYLARGLYGTEQFIGDPTSISKVYFLREDNFFKRFIRSQSELGQVFDYKALYPGEDLTTNPFTTTRTYNGISLRPYAPINPEITETTTDDYILSWTRRTRFGGGWTQSSLTVPVNEDSHEFEIEILDASATTILRTVTVLNADQYTYTNADIITDFGSLPATLNFNVYQLSGIFGRGLSLQARDIPVTMVVT